MSDREIQAEIGARMKQAAAEKGLGAYEVAEALEVRPPTVYRWWQGESRPARSTLARYAKLVGRPVIWLEIGGEVSGYVAEALRQWVDIVAAGVPGDEAIRQVNAEMYETDPILTEDMRRVAPQMIAIIETLAGGSWAALAEPEKVRAIYRLLDGMERRRSSSC